MTAEHVEDIYPLSSMQQGMLFHSIDLPESGVYIEQMNYMFRGVIHIPLFKQAWQQAIEQLPILRTAFYWEDLEKPLQVVYRSVDLPWKVLDWRDIALENQEALLTAVIKEDVARGYDLSQAPLMHLTLIQRAEEIYQFIWNFHHLLMDGWSRALVFERVLSTYEKLKRGEKGKLPPCRPYGDYISWLQLQDMQKAQSFWQQELKGFTTPTRFQVSHHQEVEANEPYGEEFLEISQETTQKLLHLSRENQLTVNTIIQGIWAILLGYYSQENDVVFGSVVSGRSASLSGIEEMIGVFINTLPVRASIPTNMPLIEWLKALQLQQAEAHLYEYTPLLQIQAWTDIPKGQPLFESVLVFESYPDTLSSSRKDKEDFRFEVVSFSEVTNYPLAVAIALRSKLLLRMSYLHTSFDTETIQRILRHFQVILEKVVTHPDCLPSEITMLTEAEQHQLLIEGNATQQTFFPENSFHRIFETQVKSTPDVVALVDDQEQLTYSELNRRANQVAHYIQTLGVTYDTPVGLCLETSTTQIIALLGILKAGGTYVPLDYHLPKERLAFILDDVLPVLVLSTKNLFDTSALFPSKLVYLDAIATKLSAEEDTNPLQVTYMEQIAYIIYTSGSTGRPKGTLLSHRGLTNLTEATRTLFDLKPGDRILQFASLSFDASIWNITMALSTGATLILKSRHEQDGDIDVLDLLKAQAITTVLLPPSLLAVLSDEGLLALQTLISGGEACSRDLIERWSINRRFFNAYGPSEITVCASVARCYDDGIEPVLGRPLANTQMYVLDNRLQPVPVGVLGELYIGGEGLARGYLNCPELTAEHFIPHPFSTQLGARLYRTGDLVRYRTSSELEFVGRVDQQVKLRGYRIELGEIEAVLKQYVGVQSSVVLLHEYSPEDHRLIAYVVPRGEACTASELRCYLQQKLPGYMEPSTFIFMDALPMNSSGKVIRRALPPPEHAGEIMLSNTPRTHVEKLLAEIWTKVLRRETINTYDNIFELGAHSLLAMQAISQIRKVFQVDLPLRRLFEKPSIAALAEVLQEDIRRHNVSEETNIYLQHYIRPAELPLSFAQQRLWFLDQLNSAVNSAYNIPLVIRFIGKLDIALLEQSFGEIVRRHENLRTTFKEAEGMPSLQIYPPDTAIHIPVIDLSLLPSDSRNIQTKFLAAQEAIQPFDLRTGPLIRISALRLCTNELVLLLTMHHIISDGWSIDVLFKDLAMLYSAFKKGQPSPLPELPIQYADYALWQRRQLQGAKLEQHLSYWKQQLADTSPLLNLPTDHPRLEMQSFQGSSQWLLLPLSLARSLKMLGQREEATLFMVLFAAFGVLLSRYTGQGDIIVGSPVANRGHAELEDLIGFFVNTLALRTDLSDNPNFYQLLARVREMVLDAYAHQELPFEKLVEVLQPERNLNHTPLFQVTFALQYSYRSPVSLAGLHSEWLTVPSRTTKFDLSFDVQDGNDGLLVQVVYDTTLFEATTIQRMLRHWQQLLEGIAAYPERPVDALPLMTPTEWQQFVDWNTTVEQKWEGCLHELFTTRAGLIPDAIAIVFEGRHITYAELNSRANQLSNHLRKMQIGPEVCVGICIERSLEMIIGILGVLKAGGAYVPLDPDYPPERLSFVLNDTRASVVLTQQKLLSHLPEKDFKILLLDADWDVIAQESKDSAWNDVTGNNLAYIIYTSGSTGMPKGSLISHQNVTRLFSATYEQFKFNEYDTWTLFHSFAFDFSVWEIWGALLFGGRLIIVPYWEGRSHEEFYHLLCTEYVTVLNQTPSAFRALLSIEEILKSAESLALRVVIFGGEALEFSHLRSWITSYGDQYPQLVNMYGITETTVHTTYHSVTQQDVSSASSDSVIGKPLVDLQIYLLNKCLQPVPIGVVGEMYVAGPGISRGYLNLPELTANRFIPNPFSYTPGNRLYKTGDLARYRPDGVLEFLGRNDAQVKLRGYRVELGEIEIALQEHPAVREVAVLAREDSPGNKELVAYVVPQQRDTLVPEEMLLPLPNNLSIFYLNRAETRWLYSEIFEHENYLQHGITLTNNSCVFDVGANIGLFSLFIYQRYPQASVYAFEPIAPVFDILRKNMDLYGLNARLFEYGLSNTNGDVLFTFYPRFSVMSGMYADAQEDREVSRATMHKQDKLLVQYSDELLTDRFKGENYKCKVRTLSEVMRENDVEFIDLLKIDVEKSEWEVLCGIQEEDWPKIKQIIVEVHDRHGHLTQITDFLKMHNYIVEVEQDDMLENTGLYNVYARYVSSNGPQVTRSLEHTSLLSPLVSKYILSASALRSYLQGRFPDYMIPSHFMVLDRLPLSPSNKLDRRALPPPEQSNGRRQLDEPRTREERLIRKIWARALNREQIGIYDNFFDLGGHSLLATQVISQVRKVFNVSIPLRALFEMPVLEDFASEILRAQTENVDSEILTQMLSEIEDLSDSNIDTLLNGGSISHRREDVHG